MNFPKVSVIIPIYNAEEYLDRCIDSVLSQDYPNYELVLIDDGSCDASFSICSKYKKNNVLILHQDNKGVSYARNKGIDACSGNYIVFVDADDYIPKNHISKLIYLLHNKNVDFVCTSFSFLRKDEIQDYFYNEQLVKNDSRKLLKTIESISNAPWAKLFNKETIKQHSIKFPVGVSYGEDSIFLYDYIKYIDSIYVSKECLYFYNTIGDNSSEKKYYYDFYMFNNMKMKLELDYYKYKCINLSTNEISHIYQKFFESSINYYYKNLNNYELLLNMVSISSKYITENNINCSYSRQIEKKRWKLVLRNWKIRSVFRLYLKRFYNN